MLPQRKHETEIYHNTKQKCYPGGAAKITVCTKRIFREPGWVPIDDSDILHEKGPPKPKDMTKEPRSDNVKRAKERAFDIALLNEFSYFVTWTLDAQKIDRYDPVEVGKVLRKKLDNMVQRKGLRYLIIPEHHQDGAIHMHGLISGDVKLEDSGKKTEAGHTIYNMPDWPYGFSTAIETHGETINVAKYITKYITKDLKKIFGNFYYAGGRGLVRQAPVRVYDTDYASVKEDASAYVPEARLGFKYVTSVV